jgi:hypothetical protein
MRIREPIRLTQSRRARWEYVWDWTHVALSLMPFVCLLMFCGMALYVRASFGRWVSRDEISLPYFATLTGVLDLAQILTLVFAPLWLLILVARNVLGFRKRIGIAVVLGIVGWLAWYVIPTTTPAEWWQWYPTDS